MTEEVQDDSRDDDDEEDNSRIIIGDREVFFMVNESNALNWNDTCFPKALSEAEDLFEHSMKKKNNTALGWNNPQF